MRQWVIVFVFAAIVAVMVVAGVRAVEKEMAFRLAIWSQKIEALR